MKKVVGRTHVEISTSSPKHILYVANVSAFLKAVWQVSETELVKAVISTDDDSRANTQIT